MILDVCLEWSRPGPRELLGCRSLPEFSGRPKNLSAPAVRVAFPHRRSGVHLAPRLTTLPRADEAG